MTEPKPGSNVGADWNRALSDALGKVAEEKAAAKAAATSGRPKSRPGMVIVASLALALVLAWAIWRWMSPGPLPPPEEQTYALRRTAGAVAREVLAIRTAEGALPSREQVVHMLDDALTYQRVGDGFLITNTDGAYVVTYDGSQPVDDWIQNGGYRLRGQAQ